MPLMFAALQHHRRWPLLRPAFARSALAQGFIMQKTPGFGPGVVGLKPHPCIFWLEGRHANTAVGNGKLKGVDSR